MLRTLRQRFWSSVHSLSWCSLSGNRDTPWFWRALRRGLALGSVSGHDAGFSAQAHEENDHTSSLRLGLVATEGIEDCYIRRCRGVNHLENMVIRGSDQLIKLTRIFLGCGTLETLK